MRPESPSLLRSTRTSPARAWIEHLCLVVALAALLSNYSLLLSGSGWWVTGVLVVALVSLTSAGLRSFGLRWVAPFALVVELVALTWIFVPQTLLGVVPSWDSLTALWRLLDRATIVILEEPAPTAATAPVVLVLAAAFGLVVVACDVLLRRRFGPMLVGVLLVAVYAVPAMVAGARPDTLPFLVAAAAWLALLRTPSRDPRAGVVAVVLGAGALVAATALPPVLPDITAVAKPFGKPPPQVFGRGINPMLQLGQNLRRNAVTPAAEYTTTLDDPPYLKVAMLRDFTGKTWRPSATRPSDQFEGRLGVDRDIDVQTARTQVQIRNLRSSMLPTPYPAQDVEGLTGTWFYQRAGQTIRSQTSTTEGQRYTVTSLDIRPTAEQMRRLRTTPTPSLRSYLELPADVPGVLGRTAQAVTRGDTNDYDRALSLQSYLRDGDFTYSETAPVAQDFDGNGLQALATFLKVKEGYCVHFSSAMAVMARELGIPARIAVGYAPGSAVGTGDRGNIYEVTSDDLHAWPELYFEGVGWVGFEPTPGVGEATAFEEPQTDPGDTSDRGETTPEEDTRQNPQDRSQVQQEAQAAPEDDSTPRAAVVVGVGAILLLGLPGLLRRFQRSRRLARGAGPERAWREVEATAVDLGVDLPVAATVRGAARIVGERTTADPDALARLLGAVETARYARPGSTLDARRTDARTVVRTMTEGAPRRRRWLAVVAPRSLVRGGRTVAPGETVDA
ncbi:MAG: DUF3488 and transglutaminase-like domain-containing protein [Aeromicrobium erythreum]